MNVSMNGLRTNLTRSVNELFAELSEHFENDVPEHIKESFNDVAGYVCALNYSYMENDEDFICLELEPNHFEDEEDV